MASWEQGGRQLACVFRPRLYDHTPPRERRFYERVEVGTLVVNSLLEQRYHIKMGTITYASTLLRLPKGSEFSPVYAKPSHGFTAVNLQDVREDFAQGYNAVLDTFANNVYPEVVEVYRQGLRIVPEHAPDTALWVPEEFRNPNEPSPPGLWDDV